MPVDIFLWDGCPEEKNVRLLLATTFAKRMEENKKGRTKYYEPHLAAQNAFNFQEVHSTKNRSSSRNVVFTLQRTCTTGTVA